MTANSTLLACWYKAIFLYFYHAPESPGEIVEPQISGPYWVFLIQHICAEFLMLS